MNDATALVRKVWEDQAKSWYAERELLLKASRPVHEWLVRSVAPQPGQRLLEIAAGPGDTGLLAAPLLGTGRLVSTDIAPGMVEAARKRGEELGIANVDYRVLDAQAMETFRARIREYMLKAIREAKVHTSWVARNERYEQAVAEFVDTLLTSESSAFLQEFLPFQRKVARLGLYNSLSQVLLKLTVPGVPDIYQGTELWSFDLVDPDNRRPVDFDAATAKLTEIESATPEDVSSRMLNDWQDGRSKLFVTWKLLQLRKQYPQLFAGGDYEPLQVAGDAKDHVLAFARKHEDRCVIVVLSRWAAKWMKGELAPPIGAVWADTVISSTPRCSLQPMRDLFTGRAVDPVTSDAPTLRVADVLKTLPFAVLVS